MPRSWSTLRALSQAPIRLPDLPAALSCCVTGCMRVMQISTTEAILCGMMM